MEEKDSTVTVSLMQIGELSHALEIERELVLKTHENYRKLKKRFLELSEQGQSWKTEIQMKLDLQNHQIELLEHVKEELTEENRRLQDESLQLKSEIDEISKKMKTREDELRREFSDQIEELLRHTSTTDNDQLAQKYEELRKNDVLESEVRVRSLLAEIRTIQSRKYEEVRALEEQLIKEQHKRVELETTLQRQTAELESAKNLASIIQNKSNALHSDLNRRLEEAMAKEVAWFAKEEDFRKTLALRTASFEKKVTDLECIIEEKTDLIANYCGFLCLRRNLEEQRSRETSTIVEAFSKSNDDEKIQLEGKVKSLSLELERKEKASKALVEKLERERDMLEITVAELKKSRLHSPSKSDELECLKKVVKEKDEQLSSVTRRYRQLLHQVESSLKHLEKQQRKTSNKLEDAMIPSFLHDFTI